MLIGGESGRKARPCNIAWIRHLVQQCQAAGVATWVNQLGSKSYREWPAHHGRPNPWSEFLQLRDARGADQRANDIILIAIKLVNGFKECLFALNF